MDQRYHCIGGFIIIDKKYCASSKKSVLLLLLFVFSALPVPVASAFGSLRSWESNISSSDHHHHTTSTNHPRIIMATNEHTSQQQQQQGQHPSAIADTATVNPPLLSETMLAQQNAVTAMALAQLEQQQQMQQQQQQQQASTHNLIPPNLQPSALAPSLNGTPGYPSALIPSPHTAQQQQQQALAALAASSLNAVTTGIPLTVQDRPLTPPVYNGVNPNYPGLRVLNKTPPMFCVENFLTPFECDFLIQVAQDSFGPAPVVGKGAGEISPSRTSSTCYLAREDLPDLLRKVSLLTGKPMDHVELPQVGRYFPTQQYMQHFDAFDLGTDDGMRFAANGGQRTVTVLIYLNDCVQGGATNFPALNLQVQPRRGMALVFFPATVDGLLDKQALHAALPAIDTKYVSQCWIRQSTYNGQPSKRLPATMGVPFGPHENVSVPLAGQLLQNTNLQPQQHSLQHQPSL